MNYSVFVIANDVADKWTEILISVHVGHGDCAVVVMLVRSLGPFARSGRGVAHSAAWSTIAGTGNYHHLSFRFPASPHDCKAARIGATRMVCA